MIDVMNKTYEQYLETIKPDIYAEEGEEITCQSGHHITNFACTTYVDDDIFLTDIEDGSVNSDSNDITFCVICKSKYVRLIKKGSAKYSTIIQFWMDGEWREKKYK